MMQADLFAAPAPASPTMLELAADANPEDISPPGTIWICPCCTRSGRDRSQVNDEKCFMEASLYHGDRLLLGKWRGMALIYNTPVGFEEVGA